MDIMEQNFRAFDTRTQQYRNDFALIPTEPTWGAFLLEEPQDNQKIVETQGDIIGGDYSLIDWSNYYGLNNLIVERGTSFYDKHNREIYEGDIIIGDWHFDEPTLVEFPYIIYNFMEFFCKVVGDIIENIEIVGNIHQNPELLDRTS